MIPVLPLPSPRDKKIFEKMTNYFVPYISINFIITHYYLLNKLLLSVLIGLKITLF